MADIYDQEGMITNPLPDEEEELKVEAAVAVRQKATKESTLNVVKFLRILKFRLFYQGFRVTLMWLFNFLILHLTGAPYRPYSEIVPHLYVGGQYTKRGWPKMTSWGIGSVVNLRQEFDDRKAGIAPPGYLYLPTIDDDAPSLEELQRGVQFIQSEILAGKMVYIHCGAGVGRAATMAAAYLVSTGLTAEEAWKGIRAVRPFIRPSMVQVSRIKQFEQSLLKEEPQPEQGE